MRCVQAFDKLIGKDGKLRLQVDKPVVLVLGSGWGAHSLMKVRPGRPCSVLPASALLRGCPHCLRGAAASQPAHTPAG